MYMYIYTKELICPYNKLLTFCQEKHPRRSYGALYSELTTERESASITCLWETGKADQSQEKRGGFRGAPRGSFGVGKLEAD